MKRKVVDKLLANAVRDLEVDRRSLDRKMAKHAPLFFHYASAQIGANKEVRFYTMELKKLSARLRDELAADGERMTALRHESHCHKNRDWLRLSDALFEAEESAARLEVMVKAMIHKKDMLVNLSATVRAEMTSELRLSHKERN